MLFKVRCFMSSRLCVVEVCHGLTRLEVIVAYIFFDLRMEKTEKLQIHIIYFISIVLHNVFLTKSYFKYFKYCK